MARNVKTTVDQLTKRARQTGGISIDNDLATEILMICQQITNISTKKITGTVDYALTAGQQLYDLQTALPYAADIISIHDGSNDRALLQVPSIDHFSAYEMDWFDNATGVRLEAWCQIGRDAFIVYPALSISTTVRIDYVKVTEMYTNYSALTTENMELPDESVELALKLAECVLLVRARDSILLEKHIQFLATALKARQNVEN